MNNIYVRQMQGLGLNPKQYAELINIPYEVVKDFIYNKEGEYKMGLKDLLRRNMIEKHQEIEENYENAKIKASGIKLRDGVNCREWYEKEYTPELLLETLNLKSRKEFEKNYDIMVNGERASRWYYTCITGKADYGDKQFNYEKQTQFIEQLYDIIVNGNGEKYRRKTPFETKKSTFNYMKWFKTFDIRSYMREKGITNGMLIEELRLSGQTVSFLVNKKRYTLRSVVKLYDFIQANENRETGLDIIDKKIVENEKLQDIMKNIDALDNEEIEPLKKKIEEDDNNTASKLIEQVEPVEPAVFLEQYNKPTIEPLYNDNDTILRKILINRLTDEEKELIKIFGGNLEI